MKEKTALPRILIGAAGSGSGKTTVTCALLKAFSLQGTGLAAFKCGPDYIDPMFHREILGIPSRNLDLFFSGPEEIRSLMIRRGAGSGGLTVAEGAMGYYDGLGGISTEASSYDIARTTDTPALLVVDGKGMSVSLGAVLKGFCAFRRDHGIRGAILNRIPPALYPEWKRQLEEETGIPVLGFLPVMENCRLESRHLGLVAAEEVCGLKEKTGALGRQAEKSLDLERILEIARSAPPLAAGSGRLPARQRPGEVLLGVARDKAFCFYYEENLELLRELGARLAFFSPLADPALPDGLDGLILGGGYPELHLPELSANRRLREEIRRRIAEGLPCLAEGGGFIYLQETAADREGRIYPMAGAVQGKSAPGKGLSRFGYVILTAETDSILGPAGTRWKGHEFHYWNSTETKENGFLAEKPLRGRRWSCLTADESLAAGYPHFYYPSNREAAAGFLDRVRERKERMGGYRSTERKNS